MTSLSARRQLWLIAGYFWPPFHLDIGLVA
jgi:hypothetical protein